MPSTHMTWGYLHKADVHDTCCVWAERTSSGAVRAEMVISYAEIVISYARPIRAVRLNGRLHLGCNACGQYL